VHCTPSKRRKTLGGRPPCSRFSECGKAPLSATVPVVESGALPQHSRTPALSTLSISLSLSLSPAQARAQDGFALATGTSVPGRVSLVPGGVARNITAALAALRPPHTPPPLLLSCVGDDAPGDALVRVQASPCGATVRLAVLRAGW
jgi:hypothetical protein